jgi:NAD(P) transhydrogenase subunit beta
MRDTLIQATYLVASALFIIAIKLLNSPRTARLGNGLGALGMLMGAIATLFYQEIVRYEWILLGVVLGGALGAWMALRVRMTAMPQMVALLNGFGGGASTLVGLVEVLRKVPQGEDSPVWLLTVGLSILIGAATFSGSLIAAGKLHEVLTGRPIVFPGHHYQTGLWLVAALVLLVWAIATPAQGLFGLLTAIATILGVWMVLPVGGADMPVIVSFLNSLSGLAAAATGFVLQNYLLIIAGTLVGASGFILTTIMSKAMNRSLWSVLFEAVGGQVSTASAEGRTVRQTSAEDVALMLSYAQSVVIVPGYGMAVSQAQHAVKKLLDALQKKGVDVRFAIHPVAGRMPGHMNVLLAEADVPYDLLWEMERINPDFPQVDVALVIGANDVVNPAAKTDRSSPLYGMPILEVDKARTVVVLKRSMNPGFAGVENELFYKPTTYMLFGDAKKSLEAITQALMEI